LHGKGSSNQLLLDEQETERMLQGTENPKPEEQIPKSPRPDTKNNEIRVLFLGDEGVGKTSIIHTIVTDTFPKDVKKQFQTVTISPDLYLLPNNNATVLVDSDKSKEQQTDNEIEKAHVIILVYDVNNFDIIKKLRTYWLPRIVKINDKVPVIICGNKMDLRSATADGELESTLNSTFI